MGGFMAYSLMAAVVMTILFLTYKWLMSTTTFHALNRHALLIIIAASWILPMAMPLLVPAQTVRVEIAMPMPVNIPVEGISEPATPSFPWIRVLMGVYLAGIITTAIHTLIGAVKMGRLIRGGSKERHAGYTLVINPKAPGPFSWGRWIVVRPEDCDDYMPMVLAHEEAHLERRHWFDLIPSQINVVLQWFSPAAWLIMRELKSVHEYQADAVAGAEDTRDYQLMLLKKTVGSSFPTFADSLNHSQIKQRLTMMMKKESRACRRLAALSLPAMAMAAVYALSAPALAGVVDVLRNYSGISDGKVTNSPADEQTPVSLPALVSQKTDVTEESADAIREAVADNISSEEAAPIASDIVAATPVDDKEEDGGPAIFINGQPGSLKNVKQDQIKDMSIVKNDPAYPQGKIMITLREENEKRVTTAPETLAEFKGGQKAMMEFLKENLKWPEGSTLCATGRVIVQFTVDVDGSISDPKIMRGISPEFDKEAMRVVKLMGGHWIPAYNGNTPVASQFVIPVQFSVK